MRQNVINIDNDQTNNMSILDTELLFVKRDEEVQTFYLKQRL